MESGIRRLEKAFPENIEKRIKYVKDILDKKVKLKKEDVEWLSEPCSMKEEFSKERMGRGAYGVVSKLCLDDSCNYSFALKEMIASEAMANDPYSAENTEIKITKLLNKLVYSGITPHIILYMGDFLCKKEGKTYVFLMMEKASGDLQKLIQFDKIPKIERAEQLKIMLFQILYTLRVIYKTFPDFLHGDLKPGNVLYFLPDERLKGEQTVYYLDGEFYSIPSNSYKAALSDFGFSTCVSQKCDNKDIEDLVFTRQKPIGIQTEKNHYKDIFRLFRSFLLLKEQITDEKTEAFLKKYVTKRVDGIGFEEEEEFERDEYYNLIPNIEPYTIDEILKDSYFDSLRGIKRNENGEPIKVTDLYSDQRKVLSPAVLGAPLARQVNFDCKYYYIDYRDPRFNDPDRAQCKKSSETFNEFFDPNVSSVSDLLERLFGKVGDIRVSMKEIFTRTVGENVLTAISESSLEKIIDKFIILFTEFSSKVYFPLRGGSANEGREIGKDLFTIILLKAVFMITGRHHAPKSPWSSNQFLNYIIQYNEFFGSRSVKMT